MHIDIKAGTEGGGNSDDALKVWRSADRMIRSTEPVDEAQTKERKRKSDR